MDKEKLKATSEHICKWLDDHPGFSFNWLCKELKVDGANMQRCRQKKLFPKKHIPKMEAILKKQHYIPFGEISIKVESLPNKITVTSGGSGYKNHVIPTVLSRQITKKPHQNETSPEIVVDGNRVLHPEQQRFPGRYLDEGIIDWKIRTAK